MKYDIALSAMYLQWADEAVAGINVTLSDSFDAKRYDGNERAGDS